MNADDRATSGTGSTFTPRGDANGAPVSGARPQRSSLRPISQEMPTTGQAATSQPSAAQAPSPYAPVSASAPAPSSAPPSQRQASPFAPVTGTQPVTGGQPVTGAQPVSGQQPVSDAQPSAFGGAAAGVGATVGAGFGKLKDFASKAKDDLTAGDDIAASERKGGPRKVRVLVSRVDPWSALKIGFLLSIAIGIMTVVAVYVLWGALNGLGVFALADDWVKQLFTEQEVNILPFFELDKWMSATVLIAVVNVVLLTALTTLGAFLYNTVAKVVGGIYVTLTDD